MGSGTTLIQGNEMKMHTIGIDISPFNCLIAQVKAARYDVAKARSEILDIEQRVTRFSKYPTQSGEVNYLSFLKRGWTILKPVYCRNVPVNISKPGLRRAPYSKCSITAD